MNFEQGEIVICVKSGADAPNPWHRANPLTIGAEYTILKVSPQRHADGHKLEDLYAVDTSGRLWSGSHFRRKERKTDITFAFEILRKCAQKKIKADHKSPLELFEQI